MDAFELEKIVIVVFGFSAAVLQSIGAYKSRGASYAWIKWGYAIAALYWSVYYLQSVCCRIIVFNHQAWIRTPLLLTITLVLASGISYLRSLKK